MSQPVESLHSLPDISQRPGWPRSMLIHFAGADPRLFAKLPEGEASEFAKIGVTVLVPFTLALSAGSFTLYTLQDQKSVPMAVAFGTVWALAVLVIDIAVMSQLIKAPPPRPVAPPPRPAPRGFGRQAEPEPAPPPPPPRSRNRIVALIRILIAATIGTLMSHCLVLAVFQERVMAQVQKNQDADKSGVETSFARLDDLIRQRDAATAVLGTSEPAAFQSKYEAYASAYGLRLTAPTATTPSTGDATDPGDFAAKLRQETEADRQAFAKEKAEMEAAIAADQQTLDLTIRDLTLAKLMLETETAGRKSSNFEFNTPDFKALGPATTDQKGVGTRATRIKALIETTESNLPQRKSDLSDRRAALTAKQNAFNDKILARENRLKELETTAGGVATAAVTRQASLADEVRGNLRRSLDALSAEISKLTQDKDQRLAGMRDQKSDILEQTEALHDLAFRSEAGTKRSVILGMIVLIFICFMLIDLAPLLMKLLKQPGLYEELVQGLRQGGLASLQPAPLHPPAALSQSQVRPPSPTASPRPHRNPPPPPPRR